MCEKMHRGNKNETICFKKTATIKSEKIAIKSDEKQFKAKLRPTPKENEALLSAFSWPKIAVADDAQCLEVVEEKPPPAAQLDEVGG